MEGHCSTGQSPQWAVVPMEEEEEDILVLKMDLISNFKQYYLSPSSHV
jgi:hypothetical protein